MANTLAGYARFDHETKALVSDVEITDEHRALFGSFMKEAMQSAFPCIGAQKALRDFRVLFCLSPERFNAPEGAVRTAEYLYRWAGEANYVSLKNIAKPTAFVTSVIIFPPEENLRTECRAEMNLWRFLQQLHRYDKGQYDWTKESSNFVYSNRFSMSIGGYAHFILFFSPVARTPSRKFHRPMLVCNPHFLFEKLRTAEVFADWRDAIRKREEAIQSGWVNPKLKDFGSKRGFEAPQYALTLESTFNIGQCPFTGKPRPKDFPNYEMSGNPFV